MLGALPAGGPPYYEGPVDGVAGTQTTEAVRRFQRDHGLTEDGAAGPVTRRALVTDYMALDGTSLPPGTPIQTHGCGEAHPQVPTPDETDEPANRRVEVFLFEGPIDPPPRDPCRDCPEYAEWLRRTVHTIDLGDDPGWLDVAIVDGGGQPLADVMITARGPTPIGGTTRADGTVRFEMLIPGRYHVTAEHPRFDPAGADIDIRAGHPGTPRPQTEEAPASDPPPFKLVSAPEEQQDQPAEGGSRLEEAGDNRLVGFMWVTVHVFIFEEPDATLRDAAREHHGPAPDAPWERDKLVITAHYQDKHTDPVRQIVVPSEKSSGKKYGYSRLITPSGPTTIGVTTTISLEREGPHQAPIIWPLDPPGPLNDTGWKGPEDAIIRKMSGRARISMWANGTEIVAQGMKRTGVAAKATGLIDDVSLIAGLFNQLAPANTPPTFKLTSPAGEPAARAWYAAIIDECHRAGVQILAGWGLPDVITEGTKPGKDGYSGRLNAWLSYLYTQRTEKGDAGAAVVTSQLAQFATNLITAADVVPGWDGISFDLESIHAPPNSDLNEFRLVLGDMYRAVADVLRTTNRICAVTVGGNHGDDLAQLKPSKVEAVAFAKAHAFAMAKGAPNLILRAMAYDNAGWKQPEPPKTVGEWTANYNNSDPAQMEYHRGVIDYALDEKRLHPAQFQLGIKTLALPSAADNTKLPNPMLGGNVSEQSRLVDRAANLLRPARCGAAWFTIGTSDEFWNKVRAFNTALNGPPAIAPLTLGQPLHVPHDATSLARLKR